MTIQTPRFPTFALRRHPDGRSLPAVVGALALPALLAASAAAVPAQAPLGTGPAEAVDAAMAEWGEGTPGGVVAVTRGGEVVFARGYGEANLEYGVPNTPATPYHMASVSKQFTAFAILMLAEEGRLSLDDDVRGHLPELADFGETITLRHLLTHTSGLRDQWTLWVMSGGRMDDVIRQEDLLGLVLRQRELNFPPGSEYLYSNSGYMLLAETVERVTGEEFRDWMRANVFEPLGMASTQIYDDHERIVPGRAYSYRPLRDDDGAREDGDDGEGGDDGAPAFEKAVLSYANAGATSLFTTAEDLARWLRNYRTAEVGGPAVVARLEQRGVLTGGDTIDYALGVVVDEHRGLRRVRHGGADAGYRTLLAYYPELDAGVIVLGNVASFNAGRVAERVAVAFFGREMAPDTADAGEDGAAPASPDVVAEAEALEAYVGRYYSPELETAYVVAIEDGALVARHRRHGPIALTPREEDRFRGDAWFFGDVVFERDATGVVTGMRVSNGRVRDLRFDRDPGTR